MEIMINPTTSVLQFPILNNYLLVASPYITIYVVQHHDIIRGLRDRRPMEISLLKKKRILSKCMLTS